MMKKRFGLSMIILTIVFGMCLGQMNLCHAAVTEADLAGNFLGISLYPDEIDNFFVTLDGEGGWQITEPTETGTYFVNENNLLTILADDETIIADHAFIDPEGRFFSFLGAGSSGFEFAMKLANIGATDLNGQRYNYLAVSRELEDDEINWDFDITAGHIEFEVDELSVYNEYDFDDGEETGMESGIPYELNAGVLSIGGRESGILPDGNLIVIPNIDENLQEIIFLMKAGTPAKDDIFGRYNLLECQYDTMGRLWEFDTGSILFDGKGNYTVPGEEGETGTYDIDANGRIVMNGETTYGPVSPDGTFIIVPWGEEDDEGAVEEIGASFIIKAPNPTITNITSTDANVTGIDSTQSEAKTDAALKSEYQNVPDNFKALTDIVSFTATVSGTDPCAFQFETTGQFGTVSDKVLLKVKTSSDSLAFDYAGPSQNTPGNYVDGTWWITDATDTYLSESDTLSMSETYTIHMAITDNGDYDLDPEVGVIEDPTVLGAIPRAADPEEEDDDEDGGSGGGGGCFIHTLLG